MDVHSTILRKQSGLVLSLDNFPGDIPRALSIMSAKT